MVRKIRGKLKGKDTEFLLVTSHNVIQIADMELNREDLLVALGLSTGKQEDTQIIKEP